MRCVFLLAAVLMAASAHARIVSDSIIASRNYDMTGVTTIDGYVGLQGLRWTIPGLDIGDVGTTFVLTEENSASYGFDWAAAEFVIWESYYAPFGYGTGFVINGDDLGTSSPSRWPHLIADPKLIDMRYRIIEWRSDRVSVLGAINYGKIPEPTSFLFACLAFCGLSLVRVRRVRLDTSRG
jgi:hypothetical protein